MTREVPVRVRIPVIREERLDPIIEPLRRELVVDLVRRPGVRLEGRFEAGQVVLPQPGLAAKAVEGGREIVREWHLGCAPEDLLDLVNQPGPAHTALLA